MSKYNIDKEMTIKNEITKAAAILQKKNPFFSYLISRTDIREAKEKEIPEGLFIGANENGNIIYKKEKLKEFSNKKIRALLTHEALHIALEHLKRKKGEGMLWNVAIDITVNNMLKRNGFVLPEGIIPHRNRIDLSKDMDMDIQIENISEKTAEEIYNEMKEKQQEQGQQQKQQQKEQGQGQQQQQGNEKENQDKENQSSQQPQSNSKEEGEKKDSKGSQKRPSEGGGKCHKKQFDEHLFEEGTEEKETGELKEKDWEQVVMDAKTHAKMKGEEPLGMKRVIDEITNSKVAWEQVLRKYIKSEIPIDWTYRRPHKKSRATGTYLPDIKRGNINIVATIDTSGSIDKKILTQFVSEIVNIVKSSKQIKGTVLIGGAEVKESIKVKNGNVKKLMNSDFKGGGGTDHRPFYKRVKKNRQNNIDVMINLTDGYTTYPQGKLKGNFDSIWVITKRGKEEVPFGKRIEID